MAVVGLGFNQGAATAALNLGRTNDQLTAAVGRISSGEKGVAEDASGVAIRDGLRAAERRDEAGTQNLQEGLAHLNNADDALAKTAESLQKMEELALRYNGGVSSDEEEAALAQEFAEIQSRLDQEIENAGYKGTNVLTSTESVDIKFGFGGSEQHSIGGLNALGGNLTSEKIIDTDNVIGKVATDEYLYQNDKGEYFKLDTSDGDNELTSVASIEVSADNIMVFENDGGAPAQINVIEVDGELWVVDDTNTYDGVVIAEKFDSSGNRDGYEFKQKYDGEVDFTEVILGDDFDNQTIDSGEKPDASRLIVQYDTAGELNVAKGVDISSSNISDVISDARNAVGEMRIQVSDAMKSSENMIDTISARGANYAASAARITEVDYAKEMTDFAMLNVKNQAGLSILAQANQTVQAAQSLV